MIPYCPRLLTLLSLVDFGCGRVLLYEQWGYAVSGNQWPGYGSEDTEDFTYFSTMGDGEAMGGYHHSDTNSEGANRVHMSLDKQALLVYS